MTTDTDGTPTPEKVARLATQQVRLDLTALIGVFGSLTAPGALVRVSNGDIHRVGIGDAVAGGTVAAIGEDSVVIARQSRTTVLRLPEG